MTILPGDMEAKSSLKAKQLSSNINTSCRGRGGIKAGRWWGELTNRAYDATILTALFR